MLFRINLAGFIISKSLKAEVLRRQTSSEVMKIVPLNVALTSGTRSPGNLHRFVREREREDRAEELVANPFFVQTDDLPILH